MSVSAGAKNTGNASPFGKWETWGLALPPALRARLVHSWLRARIAAATAFTVAGAALGLFWDWHGAFAVAGIASIAIVDAWTRMRRRAWRNPIWSVLLDITLIYVGMGAASVPDSAFGIPYVYMLVSALLLLNPPSALVAIAYASATFPLLVNVWPEADPSTSPLEIITAGAITDLVLALGLLGLIMTTIRVANREARRRAHQARLQSAIARASNALLSGSGDNPIETSLYALLDATDAAAVFVEMNVDHPLRGVCTSLIAEVTQDFSPPDPDDLWKMVSWTDISGRELLESGLSHVVRFSELEGEEKRLYAESDIRSELDIPIFVAGKWWGLVGFGDTAEDRSWLPSDETLLFTAAEMIGAFVERAEARDELSRTIDDLDLQLRYQNGLAECAALLQTATETDAVGNALTALLGATQAAYVYLEEPSEDGEPSVTHSCGDREAVRAAAAHRAWRRKDAGAGTRSAGATAKAVDESEHDAPRIPTGPASQWELRLPVAVQGEQRASIVFADHSSGRAWTDQEIRALQTAAQMIGAFWGRLAASERLEELIRSKDEFVAAVSHELRTPLTSVVGLAAELRDRSGTFREEEATELISIIADQSTEVADLVNDLLVVARAEINTLVIDLQPIAVLEVVDAVTGTGPQFESVATRGPDVNVVADPMRTRQILRNLIANASRYGGDNLRVDIAICDSMAAITVADDGPGVGEDQREAIFEPYRRAHHVATQPASVGLGLAVARHLARLMDGDLVYERNGGWTQFVLTLPLERHASLHHIHRSADASPLAGVPGS